MKKCAQARLCVVPDDVTTGLSLSPLLGACALANAMSRPATPRYAGYRPSYSYSNPYRTNWGGLGDNGRGSYQTLMTWNPSASVSPAQGASGSTTLDPHSLKV
jgi:hypothetical protein